MCQEIREMVYVRILGCMLELGGKALGVCQAILPECARQ